jgi:hypothetical protein
LRWLRMNCNAPSFMIENVVKRRESVEGFGCMELGRATLAFIYNDSKRVRSEGNVEPESGDAVQPVVSHRQA